MCPKKQAWRAEGVNKYELMRPAPDYHYFGLLNVQTFQQKQGEQKVRKMVNLEAHVEVILGFAESKMLLETSIQDHGTDRGQLAR